MKQSLDISQLVFIEGILVPHVQFSGAWTAKGMTQCSVSFLQYPSSDQLLPGSRIEVYDIIAPKPAFERRAMEVDISNAYTDADLRALRFTYADECFRSIGARFRPTRFPQYDRVSPNRPTLPEKARQFEFRLRFAGELIKPVTKKSAEGQSIVQWQLGGLDNFLTRIQIIQLVRGHGTFSEEERVYFGQDPGREGAPSTTILESSGRRAFANAVVDLLNNDDENFAVGIRRLVAEYAASVNDFWWHKFHWHRVPNRLTILDDDLSVETLIGTRAFRNFLRDRLQSSYLLPLSKVIAQVLEFIDYRLVCIPSPPYFPIVPTPDPVYETRTVQRSRRVPTNSDVLVRWNTVSVYNDGTIPADAEGEIERYFNEDSERYQFRFVGTLGTDPSSWYRETEQIINLPSYYLPSGRGRATLENDRKIIRWELSADEHVQRYGITTDPALVVPDGPDGRIDLFMTDTGRYEYGETYSVEYEFRPNDTLGSGIPAVDVTFNIFVGGDESRIESYTEEERIELEPEPQDEYYDNRLSRLSSMALLPHLWWACPPACNVVTPEVVKDITIQRGGQDEPTRTMARVAPGMSGSNRSYIERFSAPEAGDLNPALRGVDDDRDPMTLRAEEFIYGNQTTVMYFDKLARLVREEEYERYVRAKTKISHWRTKLGQRGASVITQKREEIVTGAPMLVIQAGADSQSLDDLTPEQRQLIDRLRILRFALRQVERCINRYSGLLGGLRILLDYIRVLINTSSILYQANIDNYGLFFGTSTEDPTPRFTSTAYEQRLERARSISEEADRERLGDDFVEGLRDLETRVGRPSGPFLSQRGFERQGSRIINVDLFTTGVGIRTRFQAETLSEPERDVNRLVDDVEVPVQGNLVANTSAVTAAFTPSAFTSFIGEEFGEAIYPTGNSIDLLPTVSELTEILQNIESRANAIRACLDALRADRDRIEEAIDATEDLLREYNIGSQRDQSFIGYVEQVQSDGNYCIVQLTHLRFLGEDLDLDTFAGDDLESLVAFGRDGYYDEKYRTGRIGKEVYVPVYGCQSIAEAPGVFEAIVEERPDAETDVSLAGLPPADASDVIQALTHPEVCGENCLDEAERPAANSGITAEACARALVRQYNELVQSGASSAAVATWLDDVTARVHLTLPDAYRATPLIHGPTAQTASPSNGLIDGDAEVYGGSIPARGFWDRCSPNPETLATGRLRYEDEISDDEAEVLRQRMRRIKNFLEDARAQAFRQN